MDTNNLFEGLKPGETSTEWEQIFFNRLESQKATQKNKFIAKNLLYISFLMLNILVILYSFNAKKSRIANDKYLVLSEALLSSNNY